MQLVDYLISTVNLTATFATTSFFNLKDLHIPPPHKVNVYISVISSITTTKTFQMAGDMSIVQCPLCQNHFDSQEMAFQCPNIKAEVILEGIYQDIFKDDIPIFVAKTLTNIVKFRDEYLEGNWI